MDEPRSAARREMDRPDDGRRRVGLSGTRGECFQLVDRFGIGPPLAEVGPADLARGVPRPGEREVRRDHEQGLVPALRPRTRTRRWSPAAVRGQ